MKVVVIGATGATGQFAVQRALAAGHEVTVLARDPAKLAATEAVAMVKGDATSPEDLRAALAGKDAVIAILSPKDKSDTVRSRAARVLIDEMKKASVKRLVWVSASGVGSSKAQMVKSSFVFGRIIMPLFMKQQYEDAALAEETIRASDLEFTVVRPVQLVNASTKQKVGASIGDEKLTRLQIAREDVAAFLVEQLSSSTFVKEMPVIYG